MMPSAARGCAAFKRRYDPRVTSIGRLMRRASLDELPQLICVLKGEMSLVGPRPVPATELTRYGAAQDQYQSVRPGLSGLWQVSGRNALPYPDRIALDVRYSRNVSFVLDLKILCATLREIWRMSGR
jgi:exopolysaccharide production protein ExoY